MIAQPWSHVRRGIDPCIRDGCNRVSFARGMCHAHYAAWYRAATPDKHSIYNERRRKKAALASTPADRGNR